MNQFSFKRIRAFMFLLIFSCSYSTLFSQGEVPVNMYTGTPGIEVPIWNVSSHDLSEPVSLVYNAKGVRLAETNGRFGISWDVRAGGSITREVRGLPDDFQGSGLDHRRGWIYQKYGTSTYLNADVATFANTADQSSATCTDELTDYNKIKGYGYDNDTQPDLFHYSAGGISGSFVLDNTTGTPVVRLLPYQDVKITVSYTGSGMYGISAFTITTNTGVVYTFNETVSETRYTEKVTQEATVEFFKTDYELYTKTGRNNASVSYYTEWKLSAVTSPSGDLMTYGYMTETVETSQPVKVKLLDSTYLPAIVFSDVIIYTDNRSTTSKYLNLISSKDATEVQLLHELFASIMVTSIKVTDKRDTSFAKTFVLTYYNPSNERIFLRKVQEISPTDSLPPYTFDYYGRNLPKAETNAQDLWGYYNGRPHPNLFPKLYVYPDLSGAERFRYEQIVGYGGTSYVVDGANRGVNLGTIQTGTLKMITYPWGGSTTLTYESNQYLDPQTNLSCYGGGLRIKSMEYKDGLTTNVKIEKSYTYIDSNGKSTGRLINKPVFGMISWEYRDPTSATEISTATESGNWTKFLVVTESDLGAGYYTQGSSVGYKEVKVFRPGAGYAHYEYDIPADYGTSTSGDWAATVNKFVRGSSCPDMRFASTASGINSFPYAPNPEFDYEQGLVKRKRSYNESSVLVEDMTVTYQTIFKTGSTPYKVWGLNFEKYPNSDSLIFFFGKYFLLTDAAKVPLVETLITYDANNAAKNVTQTTEYTYGSANHKLLTQVKNTTSEGNVYRTYLKYPLDYGTIPSGADKASMTIGTLQTTNRNGIPIEKYQTLLKPGGSEKVIGGSIIKFNDFGTTGKVLPEYNLSWNAASPKLLSSFTISYVHATTKLFTPDTVYEAVSTAVSYGALDKPTSSIGQSRIPATIISGYSNTVPVVAAQDALSTQFLFSDFEIATSVSFTGVSTCTDCGANPQLEYGAGRTGTKSLSFSEAKLSKTVVKGADKYIFSGWVKHSGSAVTCNVKIKNTTQTTTYYNQNLTFTPTTAASTYEYFEYVIPIDQSLSSFYVEIIPVTNGTWVDDVGFYPSNASLTSYTYTFPYGAASVTSKDKTTRTVYDELGRVKYIKDKNNNILQKQVHQFTAN